ncbi:hypothetical protein AVEN_157768-1 [Araneus ventricosus]|uniref:Uncharacterized protein n=1 Tax=Araneus ventricosus TaxID=182803 RepID=A0A4Y2F3I0_ARAVE|nr:hypothetical protein AVEN_157768-1 [Araneus ventricosus]
MGDILEWKTGEKMEEGSVSRKTVSFACPRNFLDYIPSVSGHCHEHETRRSEKINMGKKKTNRRKRSWKEAKGPSGPDADLPRVGDKVLDPKGMIE